MSSIRLLVADDHDLVRSAIGLILSSGPNIELCGEAKDGLEALRKAQELLPDLILLDINMPGTNGIETTRLLRQKLPQLKILLISQNDPGLFLPAALDAGADGVLDKSRLAVDLIPAIDSLRNASSFDALASAD